MSDTSREALKTTIMLCNIPSNYSRESVLDVLQSEGFMNYVNLIYVPMNLRTAVAGVGACDNFGYGFVSFDSPDVAERCMKAFQGFNNWTQSSDKALKVEWAETQDFDVLIGRYRNCPIMHESVEDELKPAMFKNGVRVKLPEPTKSIRAPRYRRSFDECK